MRRVFHAIVLGTALVAAARAPNGYLNTYTQLKEPNRLWGLNDGNDNWRHDLSNAGATYGVEMDCFNRVGFEPVETQVLRLEVQQQPGWSGGILEWKAERPCQCPRRFGPVRKRKLAAVLPTFGQNRCAPVNAR